MQTDVIKTTASWVERVVIGCNFCPFANHPFTNNRIHYEVVEASSLEDALVRIHLECQRLDANDQIETSLVIFPNQFEHFHGYLDLVGLAEELIRQHHYEGIYQVASFHPNYQFAGSEPDDPANYTNRSPYPMIHLLREASISKAVDLHPDVDNIPNVNIAFARQKGLEAMKNLMENGD